ncbi:MAG TPA: hypothetical protein VNL39_09755 [Xanthobacteraceae bacterium]|nr:hypothetical protein [Xanthobacteraceae bacterium]
MGRIFPTSFGTTLFRGSRYDGGGMRYLRFRGWLDHFATGRAGIAAIYFEEVRRHIGTDAAHLYGGFLATLTAWCEQRGIPYQGVPVGSIKRHVTGKGNALPLPSSRSILGRLDQRLGQNAELLVESPHHPKR